MKQLPVRVLTEFGERSTLNTDGFDVLNEIAGGGMLGQKIKFSFYPDSASPFRMLLSRFLRLLYRSQLLEQFIFAENGVVGEMD